jgi:hypothetical protein
MEKKISVIALLAIFLLASITATAKTVDDQPDPSAYSKYQTPGAKLNIFGDEKESYGASTGKIFFGPSIANTVAPSRWVWNTETTWQDRQKYITMGRQIAYAGYYSANCDYVYMNWAHWSKVGATDIRMIYFAVFDWNIGTWDLTTGGSGPVSENAWGRAPVLAVTPDNGWSINCYRTRADDASPYYTGIAYSLNCATLSHNRDTVPPPPNVGVPGGTTPISTGLCDDLDGSVIDHPYIFPHIDVDTTDDGLVITHVATYEGPYCDLPDDWIDVASICYMRKVATVHDQPWGGDWEGPYFMDSSYLLSQIVRADRRPGNHTVYFAYMKPMYYASGPTGVGEHPCTNIFNSIFWQWTHDVVYKVSPDDGVTWSDPIYVTDAKSGFDDNKTEPANQDLSALIDPDGTFHLVWNSQNWNAENPCSPEYGSKLWHWDNSNNCISLAYDGSHPAYFQGETAGAWNIVVGKCNISWCDGKMYISFTRFGAHAVGDTAIDYGHNDYLNGDIMVICSDTTGNLGQTWSNGINLTDTQSEDCEAGDCFSEHWSSMAMYSYDSLMITYVEDKEPGSFGGGNDENVSQTDNPIMFMTWPCFTMADVGSNSCVSSAPTDPTYPEIALAPLGQTAGCTTPAEYETDVTLTNCGNQNLNYTAVSNQPSWLTVESGASGPIAAGTGPRGADLPAWNGAPGCAAPAVITWKASSTTLAAGGYDGSITVDIVEAGVDDFEISVHVVVACLYYLPEYATLTSGCWTIDVWNTPQAGNGSERAGNPGNMRFYACGGDTTLAPLYSEAFIVGWKVGSTIKCYTDNSAESYGFRMRALSPIDTGSVGNEILGEGFHWSKGFWCTPDSLVKGMTEYFVPRHQDTAVLIEKITLWNESGGDLNDFLFGEGIDWDVRQDSNYDTCGVDASRNMVYQRGHRNPDFDSVVAGCSPYIGHDENVGGACLENPVWIYPDTGYHVEDIYNYLTGLDDLLVENIDSSTDLNSVFRFYEGTLGVADTLVFIKIKAISLSGVTGLQTLIDKGKLFVDSYGEIFTPPPTPGTNLHNQDDYLPQDGSPVGTVWHELYPNYCTMWLATGWIDNGDGYLSYCDTIEFIDQATTEDTIREHVELVTTTITVQPISGDTLYLEELTPNPLNNPIIDPIGTFWHEVYPTYCVQYMIQYWTDNGNGYLDSCDYIELINQASQEIDDYHVIGVATDIVITTPVVCVGICGDANSDGTVNVSDAVFVINYVFVGGDTPVPLACGDSNSDGTVNVSDAVYIINYVFVGGDIPEDCSPGSANWIDGDCCPFVP